MTDLEIFKAIVRLTQSVAHSDVPGVVQKVRELVGHAPIHPRVEAEPRIERSTKDRLARAGFNREAEKSE